MLLLESVQSVANRLESVCWDSATDRLAAPLEGMPYVEVKQDGKTITNSLLEAHRLNSVYIENSDAFGRIKEAIGHDPKKPFDRHRLAKALLQFDPNSLIHGAFLESIAGTLRLPRALSGFIEARDAQVASSGGVKNDRVNPGKDADAGATAKEGYGNVPFHRDEFTAAEIKAFFNIDIAQLRSYQLGETATAFLYALALWKIQAFLSSGLRLRTACDLDVIEVKVTRPEGTTFPAIGELEASLRSLIQKARSEQLFSAVLSANFAPDGKKKSNKAEKDK